MYDEVLAAIGAWVDILLIDEGKSYVLYHHLAHYGDGVYPQGYKMEITLEAKDGRLYLPVQGEVEDIALETLDDHYQIYFEPVPLVVGNKEHGPYLMYDKDRGGWEILRH